jgi:Flp pilus assembly protein TadD
MLTAESARHARALLKILCALLVPAWLVACASIVPDSVEIRYSEEELIPETAPFSSPGDVRSLEPVDVLELDGDMKAFVAEIVDRSTTQRTILVNLLDRMLNSGPHVLHYNNLKTYTAQETFHAREGNCLSFTNLFVALAREAGLKVYFQEMRVPDNWERQGETFMYNRHVNARVNLDGQGTYVVDFNLTRVRNDFQQQRITDKAALSQYYNNMGVFWMMAERYDLSYLHLQKAISLSDEEAYFWTNLGALYHRVGDDPRSEAAWLHALEIKTDLSAASNLARYYRRVGNRELEDYFQDQVRRFRQRNPYYLYEMAEAAYYAGEYQESISVLGKAIRMRGNEEQFYRLLGLNYVKTGDTGRARKAIAKAQQYAVSDQARHTYNQKLRLLEGEQ